MLEYSFCLQHYPRCLAQAVFCVFLDAYPQSVRTFNSDFRRDLANLLTLWITGMEVVQEFASGVMCLV